MPAGTYRLAVRARPINGELVAENNEYSTVLDVRRGPARVLYVEGEPRPEFAFLRRAVAGDSARAGRRPDAQRGAASSCGSACATASS